MGLHRGLWPRAWITAALRRLGGDFASAGTRHVASISEGAASLRRRLKTAAPTRLSADRAQSDDLRLRCIAHHGSTRAVALPLATSLPSWLVVDNARSTKCFPPSSRIAAIVAFASRSSPGHTWFVNRTPKF